MGQRATGDDGDEDRCTDEHIRAYPGMLDGSERQHIGERVDTEYGRIIWRSLAVQTAGA